jgi:hypothetical protein
VRGQADTTLAPNAHLPWRAVPGSAGVVCGRVNRPGKRALLSEKKETNIFLRKSDFHREILHYMCSKIGKMIRF